MYYRLFVTLSFVGLLHDFADASGLPTIPFVDGRWRGNIQPGSNKSEFEACWASTTFDDGTTFALSKRRDGSWQLQFSNPGWRLPLSRRYDLTAQVDFYPRIQISAEAKSQTLLEIVDLDHTPLLGVIENGHTIDLTSDGFNEKYELEGSAKVIERIRNCYTQELDVE